MLRITVHQQVDSTALLLEGKLVGDWVHELRTVWSSAWALGKAVAVNLTEVSGIDAGGRRLLTEIHSAGGVLTGSGLFARALIEDITGVPS
jgi:hypothetical protein